MTGAEAPTIAAGIVSFRPDAELLLALVATLSRDVQRIYLFNNAVLDPALALVLGDYPTLVVIDADSNLGVGVGAQLHRARRQPRRLRAAWCFSIRTRGPGLASSASCLSPSIGSPPCGETPP